MRRRPSPVKQTLVAIAYSQDRAERASRKPGRATPRAQQRLLQRLIGVVHRAEHPIAVRVELGSV